MKRFDSGKEQDKLLNRIERKGKGKFSETGFRISFRRFRTAFQSCSPRKSSRLIIRHRCPTLLKGLKQALRANEFEFKYFIAPIRNLLPNPNLISLYLTQYILEVIIKDPSVSEVYGTDSDIYKVVNDVMNRVNVKFERAEKEITEQLARNKNLTPGSRDYDITRISFSERKWQPQTDSRAASGRETQQGPYPYRLLPTVFSFPCHVSLSSSLVLTRAMFRAFSLAQSGARSSEGGGSPVRRWITMPGGRISRKSITRLMYSSLERQL
jgi:hypothetical protein